MIRVQYFICIFLIIIGFNTFSQNSTSPYSQNYKKNWVFSIGYGAQISGIKSEDFIASNVSPAFVLNVGNWVTPEIAIQAGYKGFYFHTIADNEKHHYHFLYGEVLFNVKELINGTKVANDKLNIIIHPGAGYFYNKYYNQPNICANFGIINSVQVFKQFEVFIDVSAIMGWDIYQGNEDILPSFVLGLTYAF